jgi:hypothetical protein
VNCIYTIGKGWTNNPFYEDPTNDPAPIVSEDAGWNPPNEKRSKFGNHAFCMLFDDLKIYDACLKVDTDANPDYGPPFTATWAYDWNWSTYKTKIVDDNPYTATSTPITYTFPIADENN